jgi:hypothetical protein
MAKQNSSSGNTNTNNSKLFDAVALEQQTKYYKNGLDYISNDNDIITRDDAGNIVLVEDAENNPKLLINAVTEQISTKSVLRVINTRFQYYKFPVQTLTENLDLNLDLDLKLELDLENQLAANAIPVLPIEYKPTSDEQVTKSNTYIALNFNSVIKGQPQINPGAFTITQAILDLESDIQLTVKIVSSYNDNRNSEVGFGILKYSEDGTSTAVNSTVKYPAGVNNNNKVTESGTYTTEFGITLLKENLVLNDYYKVAGFAEDQKDDRNHTVLANSSFIKIDVVK